MRNSEHLVWRRPDEGPKHTVETTVGVGRGGGTTVKNNNRNTSKLLCRDVKMALSKLTHLLWIFREERRNIPDPRCAETQEEWILQLQTKVLQPRPRV